MPIKTIWIASNEGLALKQLLESDLSDELVKVEIWSIDRSLQQHLSPDINSLFIIDWLWMSGIWFSHTLFSAITEIAPETATLLLMPEANRQLAIEQLQAGATDYILMPLNSSELLIKIRRILHTQALKESGSTARELTLLREASQKINHTLELNEVLKVVLSQTEQATGADLARIYLTDRSGQLIQNQAVAPTSSLPENPREAHLLFTLAKECAFSQMALSRVKEATLEWQNQVLQSALLLPLISGDKLIGVLALGHKKVDVFSNKNMRWLSVFCGQAATSIENARLFQDLASAYIDLAQSREQILHSRNTLQVLFDGISDGLYILDQDLTISVLNQVEAERQGNQVEQLIGQSYLDLPWSQSAPELLERIQESLQTGSKTTWIAPEVEAEPFLKDREFRIYPIRNRLAHIEQVVIFAQDVSERRRWQASLFRSANLAAVGQLAGSVAHQINNPLTIAMANSQLLLLEFDSESEEYDLSAGIFKAAERIQSIVENLLEFSNQESYFFVQTDLVNTIEGALALVLRSLKKAKIEVTKDYKIQPILSASISHLKLVWMNLLLNARDAASYSQDPQISITVEPFSEREVKVTVGDNGCGIPEKDFEQLFRPFFTTKLARKALGLGLYSTHTIVERHNGHIKVTSEPGVWTTFEVILPLDNPRDL